MCMANFTIEPRKILRKLPKRQIRYQKKAKDMTSCGLGEAETDGGMGEGRRACCLVKHFAVKGS